MRPGIPAAAVLASLALTACSAGPMPFITPAPQHARPMQPVPAPRTTAPSNEIEARLLAAHNAERSQAGTPPLRWADSLEAEARDWARVLIETNRFAHDPALHGHGENLWTGWGGRSWTPEEMIGEWIAEKAHYRHDVFPNVSRTGKWSDVGHYTQLVWRDTTHVGCAVETRADRSVLACRYAPPGNIDGRRAY